MARISKPPAVRREEIMDAALALCRQTGFEALSVEQVTQRVGVAKGTFYYHFSTKDALLTALVDRFGDDLFAHIEADAAVHEGSGLDRLRALLASAASHKTGQLEASVAVLPFLYRSDNRVLRDGFHDAWRAGTRHFLAPILRAGHDDGSLVADDPDATASVLLTLWIDGGAQALERALTASDDDGFVDVLLRSTRRLWLAMEQVLALAPDALAFPQIDPEHLRAAREPFLRALGAAYG